MTMTRSKFLMIPLITLSTILLAILVTLGWLIMLLPVIIRPGIMSSFNPADQMSAYVMKRMMRSGLKSAMKGSVKT